MRSPSSNCPSGSGGLVLHAGHQLLDLGEALGVADRSAAPVVELEAVVLGRVVRGGDHDPAVVVLPHLEEVQLGRAGQADALDPPALVGQPAGRRAVQPGGVQARVVGDHVGVLLEVAGEGPADLVGQRLVDLLSVDASDVIGLENTHAHSPPLPVQSSGNIVARKTGSGKRSGVRPRAAPRMRGRCASRGDRPLLTAHQDALVDHRGDELVLVAVDVQALAHVVPDQVGLQGQAQLARAPRPARRSESGNRPSWYMSPMNTAT